ncbi:MAG: class I SAM-dependent methyltransferase [Candidatus Nomurabacteria bacterium]
MKNRFEKDLRDYNDKLVMLNACNETLRLVMAFEFKKIYKKDLKVIELGCGEGFSIKPLLENTDSNFDLLDASKEMIASNKKNLKKFSNRLNYICEDALDYLKKSNTYNVVLSSWTIHNFDKKDRLELFKEIYNKLSKNGYFILMDKVYPDSEKTAKSLLDLQLKRYKYLPNQVCKDITEHEIEDFSKDFRISQSNLIKTLKLIGFKDLTIVDRVERDIVLVAKK